MGFTPTTSLNHRANIGSGAHHPLNAIQLGQQQQQQQQQQHNIHPLNLGIQNLPQNLSSKYHDSRDSEDSGSGSDDGMRKQSAEVLRVKAQEVLRKAAENWNKIK